MIRLDVPTPWGIRLQDSATPNAEGIHELYDHIMFYLCLILGLVSYILYVIIKDYKDNRFAPAMTIKVIGLQWYWKYEYSDFVDSIGETIEFESYVIPDDMLEPGALRLLDTDTSIVVPVDTHIRFVVTANDVIHSFTIPSLGMKIDATPGRLNQVSALIQRTGVYYGQCSELCGVNHGMMPIKLECVSIEDFIEWLGENEVSLNSSMVEQCTVNALILVQF